jgi:crotonobetainyl-CoA:carnitine CoA-transferase CaiB-like acyl-CoA transferase
LVTTGAIKPTRFANLARVLLAELAGSLEGVRVVELGHIIGGPFCGHLFADHGADVIKVEPPGKGDPMREWGGLYRGVGLYWPIIGRGKRSVTIDLRRPEGQRLARELIATADVLVENFRSGTLERWGIGWAELHRLNPRLVMVRVTGYGQDGPYCDRAGYGSVAEAMSGLRHLTGEPNRPPVRVGVSIGDAIAATQGFVGALMALYARDRPGGTGTGQMVDVALYEAMWMYMESTLPEFEKLGRIRGPAGAVLPGIAPSNVYPTADGDWVLIGGNQDSVFTRLAALAGHPEWAAPGARYATHGERGELQNELDGELAEWTRTLDSAELLKRLDGAGVPSGRIYTARDIANDEHFAARDMIVAVEEPSLDGEIVRGPGIVPKLSHTPGRVRRGSPLLGEDNDAVLGPLVGALELDRAVG